MGFVTKLVLAFWALSATSTYAQQSLFESSGGDTSIFLSGGAGVASYNLGDTTARFDYLHDNGKTVALGGGIGGTIKKGSGKILSNNAPASGGFLDAGVLVRPWWNELAKNKSCWHVENNAPDLSVTGPVATATGECADKRSLWYGIIQLRYGRDQFYTLASSTPPIPDPLKRNFNQFRGTVAVNGLIKSEKLDYRLGIAYVPASANNLSDLKDQTFQAQVITQGDSGQSILSPDSKTVYVGDYKTHIAQGINADFVVQPGQTFHYELGIDLFLRSDLGGGDGVRYASPGIGFYFFKAKAPIVPVAGAAYSYRSGKSEIAITAGWTFGGVK